MNRLVNFLQDDLKEIDESFANVKDLINYRLNYEDSKDMDKHIDRIDMFISYWLQHSESLAQQGDTL